MGDVPMMTVSICTNGNPRYVRNARNVGKLGKDCKYLCDDGRFILHNPKDGLVKLAIKLLKTIKEV